MITAFSCGYGGRPPSLFAELLRSAGVKTVVDVRITPQRASMGSYVKAKSPVRGIEKLLAGVGIAYVHREALGNPFHPAEKFPDWETRYEAHLSARADEFLRGLAEIPGPICLLCAEKDVARCHRRMIAAELTRRGWMFTHL